MNVVNILQNFVVIFINFVFSLNTYVFIGNLVNRKFYNTHKEDRLMIEIGNGRWIDGTDDPSYGVHIPPSVKPNAEIKV